jgi:regulator of cell morphogenesis and NO signaling
MSLAKTSDHQSVLLDRFVGDLVANIPGATRVFRAHRVGFCCCPDITLREAARKRDVDPDALAKALAALEPDTPVAPSAADGATMVSYILARYHDTHRAELPELLMLARKVEAVHGDHPDCPRGLADTLEELKLELEDHMMKEEMILFPAMQSGNSFLKGPISQMRLEHDGHNEFIHRLEHLTKRVTLPEGACGSWQALYGGVAKLIEDLVAHIYLENHLLFPSFENP